MKALYRRYRPRSFSELVGQEQIASALQKSIENGKISHAYLFIGPRGTGKTSVARILAHAINNFDYELEDDYLDIIEIDGASNRRIDDVRELRERVNIAPTKGKYKVYIIDEVHMLTREAFNALLKTLEEPPSHVVFIMATTDAHKVPITITSRSQVFTFKLADPGTMFEHLKNIAKKENIDITDDALKIVVKRGGGSFRDSLSLLDQISTLNDGKIDAEMLNNALGLPQEIIVEEILDAYARRDFDTIRSKLTTLIEQGIKAETTAAELMDQIMQRPGTQFLPLLDSLIEVGRSANPPAKLLIALCKEQAPVPSFPQQTTVKTTVTQATTTTKKTIESTPAETAPEPAPAPAPISVSPNANAAEIWQKILENVAAKSPLLTSDVVASKYTFKDNILKIYTGNYVKAKNIEKRRNIITEILPNGVTVEITKETLATDPEMANIAAIMGGGEEIEIND